MMENPYAAGRRHIRELNEDRARYDFLKQYCARDPAPPERHHAWEMVGKKTIPPHFTPEERRWVDDLKKASEEEHELE